MSKNKKFAGYGMHEFYMPKTCAGHTNRRSRTKCKFYNFETKLCRKIFNTCVGPTICEQYTEINSAPKTLIGVKVHNKYYGEGVVVSDNGEYCKIQYNETDIQCRKERLLELIKT